MRLKARIVGVLLYQIAVVALASIGSGCASESAKLPTYMRPELLYLNHQPYGRLYVEVDTVEGVDVPEQWLDDLKSFLSKYCSKPDGIEIVRDPPVPISEVKGMPIGAASILCLDGPDPNGGPRSAYLHVFCYEKDVGLKAETKTPAHVVSNCPTGVFFNAGHFRIFKGKTEESALKHELGHVLGLCRNPEHGDGIHCESQGCLMYKDPGMLSQFGLLFGARIEKHLCADCQRDIESWKSWEIDPKLAFKGPFLIRREDGYSVASLPYHDVIVPTDVESIDWTRFLSLSKNGVRERGKAASNKDQKSRRREWYFRGCWTGPPTKDASSRSVTDDASVLLRKAADDPSPVIKSMALGRLKELKQERDQ